MTERDAHLQLLVDGSKALSGIKAMEAALEKLAAKADATQAALDKVGAKRGIAAPRAASQSTASSSAAPQIRAEQEITSARARGAAASLKIDQDFASKRISLSRSVAKAEQAALQQTMDFRQRMMDQQARQEASRKGPSAGKVVLGDPSTASPQQTMAFQSRMQSQKSSTTDRGGERMDRIRAMAEAENTRRDQQASDAMRREAEAENRARTAADRQNTRIRAAAEAENIQRDQRAYDNMRREAENENARRNRELRQYSGMRAQAEAENLRRDQQSANRMRREAEEENTRRTREMRRYSAMRAQAEAENARFDRQTMAATRAQAEADNRAFNRQARQSQAATARQDQTRRAQMPASSSPMFVGPMPETRSQATNRQAKGKEATYDASAAIEQSMKKLSTLAMPKFDTSTAVKHAEKLSEAFAKVGSSVMSMNGAIGAIGVVAIGQSIARAGMAMENLQKGFEVSTGSAAQGKAEMERLRTETDRLGVDLQHTGKEYVNFTAAIKGGNVDAEKAKDSFFAVAQAMSLLGRSPEQAGRAFKALEQFASKGQIMSEELKGQLAEQLPGAFAIAAKSLGMSAEELGQAMANGALSANQLFAVFGDAVRGDFAVAGDKVDTASAAFMRFNNALFEIKATIANGGFLKALADGANELSSFLKSDAGKQTADQIGSMMKSAVDTLIGGLKIVIENVGMVKAALVGLMGIGLLKWIVGVAAAFGQLAVQLALLSRFMMANPIFAIATVALAGAAAIYTMSKSVSTATKEQLKHNIALKELKSLQDKLKATPTGSKERVAEIRSEISAIRDAAKEERVRAESRIKQLRELRKYEEDQSKQIQAGGPLPGVGTQETFNRTTAGTEKLEQDARNARVREMAAQRALMAGQTGFTGRMSNAGTAGGVNDTPLADNLRKALAEVERLISEQDKLASAFDKSAAAAAEIKSELEMASKIKEFDGKVSAEGLEQLKAKYQELRDAKEQVAAGPIVQDMRQDISDLDAMAKAQNRGVEAANAERVAQEARNKIVEAGIRISGAAADEIFRLAQAHEQAAQSEFMAGQRAQVDRNIQREQRLTDVLVNRAGPSRIAGQGELDMVDTLAGKGIQYNPEDGRPTKQNAEIKSTVIAGGQEAVAKVVEQRKRTNAELQIELESTRQIATLERGRSEGKARQAGELRALIDLRKEYGNVEMKDLSAEDKKFVQLKGQQAAEQFKISQGNRVGRSAPQDIYGEKLRELSESIAAEKDLAAAQNEGAAAVENQTRKQSIMNQVHALSEKLTAAQKAKLEGLIGTLYDAKTATAFEGAKMDLRDEISQIEKMTEAELSSAEAANIEAIAQEARRRAIELGVVGNDEAIRSLNELMAARLRANQEREVAKGTRENRDTITELHEEAEALKLVGVERIRRLGELQAEQQLRSQGTPRETKGADAFVESGGNRAIEEYNRQQELSIGSAERSIVATNNQIGALSLLGEAYVRRSAELQMEAQLIDQNGAATDEYSQKQIKLAGDLAVASDQLNRQNDALRGLADSGMTFNEQMRSISADGLGHMEDALVDIITGTKSVKEAFASMAKSIAADLARMAVRQAITVPLAMGLNSLFMGGGMAMGGAAMGAPMGLGGGIYHSGGIAGQDSAPIRVVPSSTFNSVPRFHSGKPGVAKEPALKAGEMPAIIKRDEGIFTPAQMASLAPAGSGGGANNTVVVSPTINVTQPQGATEEQGQKFGKGIVREMQAMVDERINHAFRPGGLRNQSGY